MIPKTIIGVYENFHFASLHSEIKPFMVQMLPGTSAEILLVKIKPVNITGTIDFINELSKKFDPGDIYRYKFLDEQINALYNLELKTRAVLSLFTVLTIFIACLGLFGLVSYTWRQRRKEVSIRKLLGATELKIVYLFSQELITMIIISSAIAIPSAYFIINNWLRNFAYQIELSVFHFAFSFSLFLPVIFFTVLGLIIKAANTNPVENLRNE
jgi:putative ABC transport system permease protein